MSISAENRNRYTYLSEIEVSKVSEDTLVVELKHRIVEIGFQICDGSVYVHAGQFHDMCTSDDVSLSDSERSDLLDQLEMVAAEG